MIQPITLLGAGLCLGMLFLRYRIQRSQPKDRPRRRPQRLKTAKLLLAAVVAWMALRFSLQHMIENIDGVAAHEPSAVERIVNYLKENL